MKRLSRALFILASIVPSIEANAAESNGSFAWADAGEGNRVVGGEHAKSCTWPASGMGHIGGIESGVCTVSLIHPEVVLTAAHCVLKGPLDGVWFGDSLWDPGTKRYGVEYCKKSPGYVDDTDLGKNEDFAYCKLARPVTGVQITPMMMGCEWDYLQPGVDVHIVGFGDRIGDGTTTYGVKREVTTTFHNFVESQNNEAFVGGDGKGACYGDSGGPVYAKLPEDKFGPNAGWRLFGVISGGAENCPGSTRVGTLNKFVGYVEKTSGIDVTPCTDAKGNWAPTADCKEAPLDPFAASGSWETGCSQAPVGGYIQSCGKPYDPSEGEKSQPGENPGENGSSEDTLPPKVNVRFPDHNQRFEFGEPVEVQIDAEDDGRVVLVELFLDGDKAAELRQEPFKWKAKSLTSGQHTISAKATDAKGNHTVSELVVFHVESSNDNGSATGTGPEEGKPGSTGGGSEGGVGNQQSNGEDGTKAEGSAQLSCALAGGDSPRGGFDLLRFALILLGLGSVRSLRSRHSKAISDRVGGVN